MINWKLNSNSSDTRNKFEPPIGEKRTLIIDNGEGVLT